jgi:hypothetical protein
MFVALPTILVKHKIIWEYKKIENWNDNNLENLERRKYTMSVYWWNHVSLAVIMLNLHYDFPSSTSQGPQSHARRVGFFSYLFLFLC